MAMDNNSTSLEVWMRGDIAGVPALLQPVAHALLQAEEDIIRYTAGLNKDQLWMRPFGLANIAFHIQHITGVIDRMFTYADDQILNEEQFAWLAQEGKENADMTLVQLLNSLHDRIILAIDYLRHTDSATLTDIRYLGRKRIPTTQIGLLFHAAEHTQRHVGQLLVTVRCVIEQEI